MTTLTHPAARRVGEALGDLGATAAEVAATLLAGGHLGEPCMAHTCPVAAYLHALGFTDAKVGPDDVAYGWDVVDLPDPVRAFVTGFDRGEHPDLTGTPVDGQRAARMGAVAS